MSADAARFSNQICQALNASLRTMPAATVARLAASRHLAITRRTAKPVPVRLNSGATAAGAPLPPASWQSALAVLLPVMVLAAGLWTMMHHAQQQYIADMADIDVQLLSDELPLSTYLDRGFSTYLDNRQE